MKLRSRQESTGEFLVRHYDLLYNSIIDRNTDRNRVEDISEERRCR